MPHYFWGVYTQGWCLEPSKWGKFSSVLFTVDNKIQYCHISLMKELLIIITFDFQHSRWQKNVQLSVSSVLIMSHWVVSITVSGKSSWHQVPPHSQRLSTSGTQHWLALWHTSEKLWSIPKSCWTCWSSVRTRWLSSSQCKTLRHISIPSYLVVLK